jgi:hypothetical protein
MRIRPTGSGPSPLRPLSAFRRPWLRGSVPRTGRPSSTPPATNMRIVCAVMARARASWPKRHLWLFARTGGCRQRPSECYSGIQHVCDLQSSGVPRSQQPFPQPSLRSNMLNLDGMTIGRSMGTASCVPTATIATTIGNSAATDRADRMDQFLRTSWSAGMNSVRRRSRASPLRTCSRTPA